MTDETIKIPLGQDEIQALIPHRYPFLLIDRIVDVRFEPDKTVTALKNVTINEPFFQGHFPGHPVMPGVLIIEAMAQAAGVLAHVARAAGNGGGGLYYLAKVDNARFSRVVSPGDQVLLEVTQTRIVRGMGQYTGTARVDGQRVASANLLCAGRREA